jgi:hypothetical protein
MHREEAEQLLPCASCGALISSGTDRGYLFGSQQIVCFECAVSRGGIYDASKDRWTVAPRVADLRPEEG